MSSTLMIILICGYIYSYVIFPFSTFSEDNNSFNDLYKNNIYTYLTIGSPPQYIPAFIMPNEYQLNIFNNICKIKSTFIVEKSKTYKSKDYEIQYGTNITLSYIINDKFEFTFNDSNKKEYIEPIFYHYRPYNNTKTNIYNEENNAYTCAYIGLKIPKYNSESPSQSLILQLKKLRVINNHCFFILYNNIDDKEGKIIIGEYPDKLDSNKYKNYQFKSIYSLDLESNYNWHLSFNSIYLKNNDKIISLKDYKSIIDHSSGIIFSPKDYFNVIYNNFFEERIKKGLCEEKIGNENIKYFSCNSLDSLKSFPILYFRHSLLFYTFELNYNDLFKKINNEYIFLICYNKEFNDVWKLGKPFLKKYLFLFNYDEKSIGFYNPLIDINGNLIEDINKDNTDKYHIITIYLLVLILVVFVLFFILSRRFYKKKQIDRIWNINNKSKLQELIYTNFDKDKLIINEKK